MRHVKNTQGRCRSWCRLRALRSNSMRTVSFPASYCVVQQEGTGEVLMVAWMNEESLRRTVETGTTWFWSRSRQEFWNKGATSGNMQQVKRLLIDCDADTLVAVVDSPGPACHTGHRSCFFKEIEMGE